jgi:CBS domain-containing protein
MPSAFNFSRSPFDALTPEQQARLRGGIDIAYYPEDTVVLEAGAPTTCLWVNIKGHVAQMEGDDTVASLGPEDVWDGRALVAGLSSHRFVASEELLAYQLPRDVLMGLIAENATFGALLFSDLGQKLSALSERSSAHELQWCVFCTHTMRGRCWCVMRKPTHRPWASSPTRRCKRRCWMAAPWAQWPCVNSHASSW